MSYRRLSDLRTCAFLAVLAIGLMFVGVGCQDDSLPTGSAPQATAEPEQQQAPAPRRNRGYGSSGSSLGKARDSAKNTINDIQDRQKDIGDQLDNN